MSQPVMPTTDAIPRPADTSRCPGDMSLLDRYRTVRDASLHLCAPLSVEDHSLQPMPDASPAKWHLAHTTWFFETFLLSQYISGYRPFHPAFRNLFNSYYNTVGDRPLRTLRHVLSRPGLSEVHAYRADVDEAMARLLAHELPTEALDLVELGINHEQQHQELIVTDVKNGLWTNPLRPAYRSIGEAIGPRSVSSAPMKWQSFPEGVYSAGFVGSGFAFDNEGPRHNIYLQPYRLASRLITNGEYLEFLRDGGYGKPRSGSPTDGTAFATINGARRSIGSSATASGGRYTIEGMQPLQLDEPVCHISYYEADAFAHWAGARLAQRVRVGNCRPLVSGDRELC